MAGKIFVNYRRDDSASHALNIAQYLEREFGAANVFLDIDRMRAGQRFPKVLEERLSVSKVMVVVIGPLWLTIANAAGQRRLDDPEDWVRMEIARALARGVTVIPVLTGGASLPAKAELPEDLKPLVDHHVATLTTNGFRAEMACLARDIRTELGGRRRWPLMAGGLATVAAAIGVAMYAGLIPMLGLSSLTGLKPSEVKVVQLPADADVKASQKVYEERKRTESEAAVAAKAKRKDDEAKAAADAKRSADEEAQRRAASAEEKRKADEIERQRQADAMQELKKTENEQKRKEAVEAALKAAGVSKLGDSFRDCPECPEMVPLPAGEFMMGADSEWEKPAHKVVIGKPFAVGKFEVTRDQFASFASDAGYKPENQCFTLEADVWKLRNGRSFRNPDYSQEGNHPASCVNWDDAKAYAAWLSRKTGKGYRLLTEAEWEYAARAGTATVYYFGDVSGDLCGYANVGAKADLPKGWEYVDCKDGYNRTAPVGSFKPNAFGLYDMVGNVYEWVEDCFREGYAEAANDGSAYMSGDCRAHVFRGGVGLTLEVPSSRLGEPGLHRSTAPLVQRVSVLQERSNQSVEIALIFLADFPTAPLRRIENRLRSHKRSRML